MLAFLACLAAAPARAVETVVVETPLEGELRPAATDAVGLGVQPRAVGTFRDGVTARLARLAADRSIAFEVIEPDGFVARELHGVGSPAGLIELRIVRGRAEDADARIGDDGTGGALVAVAGRAGALVGAARRPGIVTVDDVVATIGGLLGVDLGAALRVTTPTSLSALRAHLARDARSGGGLALATVVVGCVLLALGALGRLLGMAWLGERAAGAVLLVPLGYLLGVFLPSGSSLVRSLPVLMVPLALALRPVRPLVVSAGTAALVAVLGVLAAANPAGEPARSLWDNPFDSLRFYGLSNRLVAFLTGALVLWVAVARPRRDAAVAVAAAATVVVGAPWIGANFGGVLTLVFGATLAIGLTHRARLGARLIALATILAIAATAVALLSDAGAPVSHGGRTVRSVSDDGPGAVLSIVADRLRANWDEVVSFATVGYLGAILVAGVLVALLTWGSRRIADPYGVAAFAGAAAALLTIVTEDSGFLAGAIAGLYPCAAWLLGPPGPGVPDPATAARTHAA